MDVISGASSGVFLICLFPMHPSLPYENTRNKWVNLAVEFKFKLSILFLICIKIAQFD